MTETQRVGSWDDWTEFIYKAGHCDGCAIVWIGNGSICTKKELRITGAEAKVLDKAFTNPRGTQEKGFKIEGREQFCTRVDHNIMVGRDKKNGSAGFICYKSKRCIIIGSFDETKCIADLGHLLFLVYEKLLESNF